MPESFSVDDSRYVAGVGKKLASSHATRSSGDRVFNPDLAARLHSHWIDGQRDLPLCAGKLRVALLGEQPGGEALILRDSLDLEGDRVDSLIQLCQLTRDLR